MKFEDWYNASEWREGDHPVSVASDAWDHQERRIKELESQVSELRDGNEYILVRELRERVEELENALAQSATDNYTAQCQIENPWISVDDRLPEEYGEFLVLPRPNDDFHIISATFHPSDNTWNHDQHTGYDFEDFKTEPTHWMPIPEIKT